VIADINRFIGTYVDTPVEGTVKMKVEETTNSLTAVFSNPNTESTHGTQGDPNQSGTMMQYNIPVSI
jgi:hypothetical protein